MKTLIMLMVICFMFIGINNGALASPPGQAKVQIQDIESSKPLIVEPRGSGFEMRLHCCNDYPVIAMVNVHYGVIVRYCYLDKNVIMGFVLDTEMFNRIGHKLYISEDISVGSIEYLMTKFSKIDCGDKAGI